MAMLASGAIVSFYAASANAGIQLSKQLWQGETFHREHRGLTTTCGCLFGFALKENSTFRRDKRRGELS